MKKRIGCILFISFVGGGTTEQKNGGCREARKASAWRKHGLTSASLVPSLCMCWDCGVKTISRHDFSFLIIQGLCQPAKQHASAPASLPDSWPCFSRATLLPASNQIPFVHPWLLPHTEEVKCVSLQRLFCNPVDCHPIETPAEITMFISLSEVCCDFNSCCLGSEEFKVFLLAKLWAHMSLMGCFWQQQESCSQTPKQLVFKGSSSL